MFDIYVENVPSGKAGVLYLMSPDVNFVPRQRRVSGDAGDVMVKVDRGRPLITANLADAALGAAGR